MTRRIVGGFLLCSLIVIVAHAIPLGEQLNRTDHRVALAGLQRDAARLSGLLDADVTELEAALDRYSEQTANTVVALDASRVPLASASTDPLEDIGGVTSLPSVDRALKGAAGEIGAGRHATASGTVDFVVVPVRLASGTRAALYLATDHGQHERAFTQRWLWLAATSLVTLAAVAVVGFVVAGSLERPLASLQGAVSALAAGDPTPMHRAGEGPPAMRKLSKALEEVASRTHATLESQRAALESQRGFAADASHQLRTPLTAIKLRLDQLGLRLTEGDSEASDILDATHHETERLHRLIEGLLTLARADANTNTEIFDLAQIARDRQEMWAPLAGEKGVSLSLDVPEQLLATAVPGSVEQIIDNYIDNALDVAPQRSIISITARATQPNIVELRVTDRGPGLAPDMLAHAFDRFGAHPTPRPAAPVSGYPSSLD